MPNYDAKSNLFVVVCDVNGLATFLNKHIDGRYKKASDLTWPTSFLETYASDLIYPPIGY